MKVKLTLVLELSKEYNCMDEEERRALEENVLRNRNELLILHSNYIGAELGAVVSVETIKYCEQ